jgi:hypothetical protein
LIPFEGGYFAAARAAALAYSNIMKGYNNMNVSFLCGFDVEDGQALRTCPPAWRHANHQDMYNHSNAQHDIDARYDACTKAKHKTQLPNF